MEIDFDPKVIRYEELLDMFFASHNACGQPWSRQYMSAIFCHGEEQLRVAKAKAAEVAEARGKKVTTRIEAAKEFYLAEDYHQKYRLRSDATATAELEAIYPKLRDFVDSTAATRLNGYLAGYGTKEDFEQDLKGMGLSAALTERLRNVCGPRLPHRR